jgi:hypothetical protein
MIPHPSWATPVMTIHVTLDAIGAKGFVGILRERPKK